MSVNMAVVAPIPSASDRIAATDTTESEVCRPKACWSFIPQYLERLEELTSSRRGPRKRRGSCLASRKRRNRQTAARR